MMPPFDRLRWPAQVDWLPLIGQRVELEFWRRAQTDELVGRLAAVLESVVWIVDEDRGVEVMRPAIWRFRSAAQLLLELNADDRPRTLVAIRIDR